jgi:hypothetical protein
LGYLSYMATQVLEACPAGKDSEKPQRFGQAGLAKGGKSMCAVERWLARVAALVVLVAAVSCAGNSSQGQRLCADVGGAEGCNVVEGYQANSLPSDAEAVTISGGGQQDWPQRVSESLATIGGGAANVAGYRATVGGGLHNSADFYQATVGGGALNLAGGNSATVAGGYQNVASGDHSTVGGGQKNQATSLNATVAGGSGNAAAEHHAMVGGGTGNLAGGVGASVGGGVGNRACASWSSVGGGLSNQATGLESAVGGGGGNQATAYAATAAGGLNNWAVSSFSSIAGGRSNVAGDAEVSPEDGTYATVGGGTENRASGAFSTVPGGDGNIAAAPHSFAAGHRAQVAKEHNGAFLYADASEGEFLSVAANEFAVRATGGVRLVTSVDAAGVPLAGVRLPGGSGSWEMLSDRAAKVGFSPVDPQQILSAVAALLLATWSYTSEAALARHLGPTAQDFWAAFGLGTGDLTISAVDADGVALAAIQGLDQLAEAQQSRIAELEKQVAAQGEALAKLEAQIAAERACEPESSGRAQAPVLPGLGRAAVAGLVAFGAVLLVRQWGPSR